MLLTRTRLARTLLMKPRKIKAECEMFHAFFARIEMMRILRFLQVMFALGAICCVMASTKAQERNRNAASQPSSSTLPITQWYSAIQNKSGDRNTFRDSSGRVQATATRSGNQTTFRDSSGRVVGTANTYGDRTVLRDSSGRVVESANTNRDRTTFRSSSGSNIGSATQSRNQTTFRDSSGRSIGSTTNNGSQIITRDRSGRVIGSASRSPR
jgi:hypothetical protein